MKMVFSGATICTFDEERRVFPKGVLGVDGTEIAFVGTEIPNGFHPDLEVDCHGCVVIPGLVNTHVHLGEQLFKGLMDEADFQGLFYSRLFPWESCLEPELVYWGSLAAAVEALRCGVTTVGDMYHHAEATARAVEASGLRACIGQLIYGFPLRHPFGKDKVSFRFDSDEFERQLEAACHFAETWDGRAEGRVTTAIAPHATNTLAPWMLERVARVAEANAWLVHMHLAQMESEYNAISKQYGLGCVELLSEVGILRCRFLGAHAIFLKQGEKEILADAEAGVAHNPIANAKDAGLIAPIVELAEAGVRIGLGTDAFHSNLLEAARFAACLQRVHAGAGACPAREALYWATRGGALALGLEEVGVLEPGKKADLIVIDMERLNMLPAGDPYTTILYYAEPADIRLVLVNGEIVVKEGEILTVDLGEVKRHFMKAVKVLRSKIHKEVGPS